MQAYIKTTVVIFCLSFCYPSSFAVCSSADLTGDGRVDFKDFSMLAGQWLTGDMLCRISINVKDYGALGNGSADDSAAITAAIAALPSSFATLYFPAGDYRCTTMRITGKTGVTICGDGWGSSIIKSNAVFDVGGDGHGATPGAQVINIDSTCRNVLVFGLTFDGSCTYRKPGQQAVIIDADNTTFRDNYTLNSGEFANCFGRGNSSGMDNLIVTGNRLGLNWADGINLNNVHNAIVSYNLVDGPNDDLIAVSDCTNVAINGNVLRSRIDLPSLVGRGIAVLPRCDNIHGTGNLIEQVKQYGLYITSEDGTRPNNISFCDTILRNVARNSGSAVFVLKADNVTLMNTHVYNPGQGDCILIGDWKNLTIQGGELTQTLDQYCRGVHAIEDSGFASSWPGLIIKDIQINLFGASTNEAIYLRPHSSVTMNTVLVSGVSARSASPGNYISIDVAQCGKVLKIVNNISMESRTLTPSTGSGIVTVANNN